MPNCEFCFVKSSAPVMTRCCKSFLCLTCKNNLSKKLACECGKLLPVGKKNYFDAPQILQLFEKLQKRKGKQCDRCQLQAQFKCIQCDMIYCSICSDQVHQGSGFARHVRSKLTQKLKIQHLQKKQATCMIHKIAITVGCQCGSGLCQLCLKIHKQNCSKSNKQKNIKQFKQEYFSNVLHKIRQISLFKQKLVQQKQKYNIHFQNQQKSFQQSQKLICQQFQYLQKLLQVKYTEIKMKLSQHWSKCEKSYLNNLFKISEQIVKYDDYAQLIQLFSQNLVNLQYFDRKVKRFPVNFDYIQIKTTNIDSAQNSILNITFNDKPLQQFGVDNIQTNSNKDEFRCLDIQNASQQIMEYTNNPLSSRQLAMIASHNEIYFNFIHLPYQNKNYQIQYGLGFKIKGQEAFTKINNSSGYGVISNLKSDTKYRIRMRVVDGLWGQVSQIRTFPSPKFNIQDILFAKYLNQTSFQLIKGGMIFGSNQINFGIHKWIIKMTSKSITYQENETACVIVGVAHKNVKQSKKTAFVGTTLNYGYQKNQIIIKICLDCSQKRLTISNVQTNQEQIYQNLPSFPLFPAIQNKGNGQIIVKYNLATQDINQC